MKPLQQAIPVAWATIVLALLNGWTCCPAATLLVSPSSLNPTPPYATWATAATNIQDAIDAASSGDEIVVTNGVYATGGRAVHGTMGNRVVVDKALAVRSVNGPHLTVIQGHQLLGVIGGNGAFRCVYLTNGAVLAGFTLTNGATRLGGDILHEQSGGGLLCESTNVIVSNCVVVGNWASQNGGGVSGGTLNHCALSNNFARYLGGGAHGGSLNHCAINSNTAGTIGSGGGAAYCDLTSCTLTGNRAEAGGGAYRCDLQYCNLTGNRADFNDREGGGARDCTLNHCWLTLNSARDGGGADQCDLNNCVFLDNSAGLIDGEGGGARYSTLNNCTVVANRASFGGGVISSTARNCIIYYNYATNGANYASSMFTLRSMTLNHCCTTPLPTNGFGNITAEPLFELNGEDDLEEGIPRLQPNSPCIDAGTNLSAIISSDLNGLRRPLDGNRDGVPGFDMGAFEFNPLFFTSITRSNNSVRLSWFDTLPGMQLQAASSLNNSMWTNMPFAAGTNFTELPSGGGWQFFRLVLP